MSVKCRVLKAHMSRLPNDEIVVDDKEFEYLRRNGYVILMAYETMEATEVRETRKRGRPRKR